MVDPAATQPRTLPSATPSAEDIEAWDKLTREEQLQRYREALTHADCSVATNDTMTDILSAARERVATRGNV